jgi:hypothetical protein
MGILLFIALLLHSQAVSDENNVDRYLRDGLALEQEGRPEQALKLWNDVIPTLEYPSVIIATEYLRIAAEYELTNYYRASSSIYLDVMYVSDENAFQHGRSELEKELLRLEPIMEESEFSACQQLLNENDPELFKRIWAFGRASIQHQTPGIMNACLSTGYELPIQENILHGKTIRRMELMKEAFIM